MIKKPQENALGAPTEGLGQAVTFAFNADTSAPQLALGRESGLNAGVRGANFGSAPAQLGSAVDLAPDPTMNLIAKFADKALAANLERAKVDNFFKGMQKARAGKSIQDIAQEEPWYASIFGDSDVVEGARQYKSSTVANEVAQEVQREMPEVRKLTGDAAASYFVDKINSRITGDSTLDTAVLQNLTRTMPALMEAQTKANYGWLQEEAAKAQDASFLANAGTLQDAASRAAKDPTQAGAAMDIASSFVAGIMPAAGQAMENWQKRITNNVSLLARNGQFHAINALREAKLFDHMTPEARADIEAAVDSGESNNRARYSGDYSDDIASIISDAQKLPADPTDPNKTITPDAIRDRVAALNSAHRAATGSRMDLIPMDSATSIYTSALNSVKDGLASRAAAAAKSMEDAGTAEAKLKAEARMTDELIVAIHAGTIDGAVAQKGVSSEAVANALAIARRGAKSPEAETDIILKTVSKIGAGPALRREFTQGVNAAIAGGTANMQVLNDSVLPAYKQWLLFNDHPLGKTLRPQMYDGEVDQRMEKFHAIYSRNPALGVGAYNMAFVEPLKPARLADAEVKVLSKALVKEYSYLLPEVLGGQADIRPDTVDFIASRVHKEAELYHGIHGDKTRAITNAAGRVLGKGGGVEMLGGFAWDTPAGAKPLTELLMQKDTATGAAVNFDMGALSRITKEVIHANMGASGIPTSDTLRIWRGPDELGQASFWGLAPDSNKVIKFTSGDIRAKVNQQAADLRKAAEQYKGGGVAQPAASEQLGEVFRN